MQAGPGTRLELETVGCLTLYEYIHIYLCLLFSQIYDLCQCHVHDRNNTSITIQQSRRGYYLSSYAWILLAR